MSPFLKGLVATLRVGQTWHPGDHLGHHVCELVGPLDARPVAVDQRRNARRPMGRAEDHSLSQTVPVSARTPRVTVF